MVLLFFLGVAVHVVAPAASKWPSMSQWPHLLVTLFYQHNLVYGDTSIVTPVVWSLEIEVQFYLLAPYLATVFVIRRHWLRRLLLVCAIVAIPSVRSLVPPDLGQRFNSLPWNIEYFLAGFLLADLFLVEWRERPTLSWWGDACSLIGWPALFVTMLSGRTEFLALMALVCYVGAFCGRTSSWVFRRPVLTTIGGMCYSIYLLHYSVEMALGTGLRHLPSMGFLQRLLVESVITLPVVLLVSVLFFVLLERPCMDPKWVSRLRDRFREPAAVRPAPAGSV
jgi:peptidoglycan/LPS O-acetylase OafA/YrhL